MVAREHHALPLALPGGNDRKADARPMACEDQAYEYRYVFFADPILTRRYLFLKTA